MYRSVYYCYQCCVIITDPLRYLEDVVARAVPDRKLYRDVVGHCKRAARDDELWAALRRVAALVAYTLLGLSVLRSEVNNFHKIQNFRQISDLFSQI